MMLSIKYETLGAAYAGFYGEFTGAKVIEVPQAGGRREFINILVAISAKALQAKGPDIPHDASLTFSAATHNATWALGRVYTIYARGKMQTILWTNPLDARVGECIEEKDVPINRANIRKFLTEIMALYDKVKECEF